MKKSSETGENQPLSTSQVSYTKANRKRSTIDGEKLAGLNIRSFSVIEVFMEVLSRCLGHKCSLFNTIKGRHLDLQKNVCGTPENREKHKSLAQRIFSCLRYYYTQ